MAPLSEIQHCKYVRLVASRQSSCSPASSTALSFISPEALYIDFSICKDERIYIY